MLIRELTGEECAEVLGRTFLGRLGCARADQPYIVPIQFSYDSEHECLYAFSMLGRKIRWMRENPKVCLEVEEVQDRDHWTTVLVFGRYEEIDRTPEEAEARRRAERHLTQRQEWWLPAAARTSTHEHQDMVLYRIAIDRLTGRRAARRN